MRSTLAISFAAALAGTALAAPSYPVSYPVPYPGTNQPQPGQNPNVEVVVEKVVHTLYVTEGSPQATPCPEEDAPAPPPPAPTPEPAQPPPSYPVYQPQPPQPKPEQPSYPVNPPPAPAPKPTPQPAPAPPAGGSNDYMSVVKKWRANMGLKDLEYSAKLEANALKTATDGNGQMKHELNPGTYGQVLAPGEKDKFEHCYVGGWLCENRNAAGLGDVCNKFSEGWDYQGQVGHYEILVSPQYSSIGCAWSNGIWCCDLA